MNVARAGCNAAEITNINNQIFINQPLYYIAKLLIKNLKL